jgi:hypothetical protein
MAPIFPRLSINLASKGPLQCLPTLQGCTCMVTRKGHGVEAHLSHHLLANSNWLFFPH